MISFWSVNTVQFFEAKFYFSSLLEKKKSKIQYSYERHDMSGLKMTEEQKSFRTVT